MSNHIKFAGLSAVVAAFAIVSPAKADYVVMEDTAYPSVLFFEFADSDDDAEVISAPSSAPMIVQQPSQNTAAQPQVGGQQGEQVELVDDGHGGMTSATVTPEAVEERAAELDSGNAQPPKTVQEVAVDQRLQQLR